MARGRTAAGWTAVGAATVCVALQGDWTFGVGDLGDWARDTVTAAELLGASVGLLVLLVRRRVAASGGAAHEHAPAEEFPLVFQVGAPAVVEVAAHHVGVGAGRVLAQPGVDGPPLRRHVPVP